MASKETGGAGEGVETQIAVEHRGLDALFAVAREAFAIEGDPDATREAFAELRDVLETHFDQEDGLYYPVIWRLQPERKTELMGFVAGHREYLRRLEEIDAHLAGGEVAAARSIFDDLAQAFHQHEAAEERVLSALDRELEATP